MKTYLYVLATMVIMVMALVFPLERESFAFRDREDRDFRKITIVNPLGGENFLAGSKQEISWQASSSIGYVKIEYSTDNGKKWIEIVKNMKMDEPFASYNWEVPCTPTSKAKIRVSDVYGPDFDVIINPFSIICDSGSRREYQ
jgi:hypothetical protein